MLVIKNSDKNCKHPEKYVHLITNRPIAHRRDYKCYKCRQYVKHDKKGKWYVFKDASL